MPHLCISKYHKVGGLEQVKFTMSWLWKTESREEEVDSLVPSERLFMLLPQLLVLPEIHGVLWHVDASLLSCSMCPNSPFL